MCVLIYHLSSRKRSISSSSSEDSANHGKRHHHRVNKKLEEVDRLAEMERIRRQKEMEQRVVEEETQKRIELLVKKRVEEELGNLRNMFNMLDWMSLKISTYYSIVEKRKDEIAIEVSRKVDAAKKQMEREMMLELEKNLQNTRNKEKQREVSFPFNFFHHFPNEKYIFCFGFFL